MMTYCKPDDHTWVQVVGGKAYDPDWDTTVCIICHSYSGVRKLFECHVCGEARDPEVYHSCWGSA